jgi:hypothetical protein
MQPQPVMMTREEASDYYTALRDSMGFCVRAIESIKRRRTWRDSEKAMAIATYARQLDHLKALAQRIGEAFNIGGY